MTHLPGEIRPRYPEHITDQAALILRVELQETLVAGGKAQAFSVNFVPQPDVDGSDPSNFLANTAPYDVYDPFGLITGNIGDRFWAVYRRDSAGVELLFPICGS
jgi:hypothetical protein